MLITKGVLYGMGNPLLDMTVTVDEAYLKKYDLQPNNAILAEEQHRPIYEELLNENYKVSYSPGGATQNTIRVAQWFLKDQETLTTSFVGCIGNDSFGDKMKSCMQAEGIRTNYLVDPTHPTGVCAVLLTGKNRSLVTKLDAANHYKTDHLEQAWDLVDDASFYYIAGFFLTVSPDSMVKIGEHAVESDKCFAMNLSAPFLSQFFKDAMQRVIPYCDIIFSNEDEARAFSKDFGLGSDDLGVIAQKLSAMPKENKKRSRMVIFTQGAEPTVVFHDGKVQYFDVIPISAENIVDTNGAGDAFAGGFLSQYCQGKELADCMATGMQAANMIIQVSGCTLPGAQ